MATHQNTPVISGSTYEVGRRIHGNVHYGTNITTGTQVAIKFEAVDTDKPQLEREAQAYRDLGGLVGIPRAQWIGTKLDDKRNALVLDLLGPNLEELFTDRNRQFSLKTILLLAEQLIDRVEELHTKGYVHGNLSPHCFLVGNGNGGTFIYLIAFKRAEKYSDVVNTSTLRMRSSDLADGLDSTSLNGFRDLTRAHDMVCLGNIILYLCRGNLPWQEPELRCKKESEGPIESLRRELPATLFSYADNTTIEEACRCYFKELTTFMNRTRSLDPDEPPDYGFLRGLFRGLFARKGFQDDGMFDWVGKPTPRPAQRVPNVLFDTLHKKVGEKDLLIVKGGLEKKLREAEKAYLDFRKSVLNPTHNARTDGTTLQFRVLRFLCWIIECCAHPSAPRSSIDEIDGYRKKMWDWVHNSLKTNFRDPEARHHALDFINRTRSILLHLRQSDPEATPQYTGWLAVLDGCYIAGAEEDDDEWVDILRTLEI